MKKRILATETTKQTGKTVQVAGWVSNMRDHGGLVFIDLRDWSGVVQLVVNPKEKAAFKEAQSLGLEYVISATGKVIKREKSLINKKLETGSIEIQVEELSILNKSKASPFPLNTDGREIDESARYKYRFIDIRRKRTRDLIEKRAKLLNFSRNWFSKNGFTEVQTPLLTVSSPEGARDFLVPSRIYPGTFYALPQAPQQYKQLLMVGGVDKYFQIAPCFRDEDPRADRHSGAFYQIDVEVSFITEPQQLFELVEPFFKESAEKLAGKKLLKYPFPQIPYTDAMKYYGTDRPDLRFEMKLTDLTEEFQESAMDIFKKVESVQAILVDKDFSRKEIDDLIKKTQQEGAKGLIAIQLKDNKFAGSFAKHFPEKIQQEVLKKLKENNYNTKGTQTLFAIADQKETAQKLCGWLRLEMGDLLKLRDPNILAYAWVVDFPMYEWDENNKKWEFCHNPFSMPRGGMEALRTQKPGEITANQYDIVCNGYEISSGSIRNHDPEIFVEAFKVVGYSEEQTRKEFNHMISAFEYGAPPHGGFAPGLDRMMMILFDEDNIREIYAFPKSNARELMTDAPRAVEKQDLDTLHIELKDKGEYVRQEIKSLLKKSGAKFEEFVHEEVRTSQEAADIRGTKLEDGAKTLVLKSQEYPNRYIMAVVPANKRVAVDKISQALGEKFKPASEQEVEEYTGIKVGGIPPYGRLLKMEVYFDQAFYDKGSAKVDFNAGLKSVSIETTADKLIETARPNENLKDIAAVR